MSDYPNVTKVLSDNVRFLEGAGAQIDRILKGKESAGLTKAQIKQMQDEKSCPLCGKRLSNMEVDHLSGVGASASESAGAGATGDLKLRERAVRAFQDLGLPRAGAEAAADRGGEAA